MYLGGVQLVGRHEGVALLVYDDRHEVRTLGEDGGGRLRLEARVLDLSGLDDEAVPHDALLLGVHVPEDVAEDVDLHGLHLLEHGTRAATSLPTKKKGRAVRNPLLL